MFLAPTKITGKKFFVFFFKKCNLFFQFFYSFKGIFKSVYLRHTATSLFGIII